MPHSAEGLAYLTRLNALPEGPGVVLDDVLEPSLDDEQELRKLFAQDKNNSRLDNPHVGLVDVFGPNTESIRKTRARVVDSSDEENLSNQYIMPLKDIQRRKDSELSMVADLDEFKKNWSIFTEGSLSQLFDWNNVIAAGGSVLSPLLPLPEESRKSKRAIRKYYHSAAFPSSDVDLFLWGLTPEQAEKKIVTIYEAVRDSVPWDVTCIRTKHTISIHSQYPYRSVQIVLRLYRSPAEVLAGFDIDAPCCAYDGEHVWANPRAITAMIRQCNTVDVTRRSPSYEVRLAKYAKRGFEVYVPNLRREDVDPTIYERSIIKIEGLARLLVLEKLSNTDARYNFLDARRDLRGRPFALRRPGGGRGKRKYRGDLKTDIGGLEMNDYDVSSLHIPYGPGWDARRIEKLIYQTDLGMNSTFNPKNKGRRLHRHPAFFGTIEECMEDCCEHCPEPIDDDERRLQKEEDENYIRGRISFIEENPGRQTLSGSFNPIDEGEWSEQVYIRPIQKLFSAIASHNITLIQSLLASSKNNPDTANTLTPNGIDLQNRDHIGRTALHLAILVKDEEIAKLLMDEGCRMISRLGDGRTALHLAAQYGLDGLIEKMFEKSKQNQEEVEKKVKVSEDKDEDKEMNDDEAGPPDSTTDVDVRPSSEDDWSSDDNDGKRDDSMDVDDDGEGDEEEEDYDECDDDEDDEDGGKKKKKTKDEKEENGPSEEDLEEDESEADVLDVNASDWDQGLSPLGYAVLYSTVSTVSVLLKHGANPNFAAVPSGSTWDNANILPLSLTLVRPDEDTALSIAERLIESGASSSTADDSMKTVLHQAVYAEKAGILDVLLRRDPGAKKAMEFPMVHFGTSKFPVVSAVAKRAYAELLTLLAHGVKINPTGTDVARAKAISGKSVPILWGYGDFEDYSKLIYQPAETALAEGDYIIDLLLEIGAEFNIGTYTSRGRYTRPEDKKTILDWVIRVLDVELPEKIKQSKMEREELDKLSKKVYTPLEKINTWKEHFGDFCERHAVVSNYDMRKELNAKQLEDCERALQYFQHVRTTLESMGAKTWKEFDGGVKEDRPGVLLAAIPAGEEANKGDMKPRYLLLSKTWRRDWVPLDQSERYDELFEAAFRGDDVKIEKLCVPGDGGEDANVLPVQITVEAVKPEDHDTKFGLTPLCAAIAGKRWATAKLIMGIAAAQYHDEGDSDKDKLQASLFDLVDESDEDVEMSDGDSCYSDETIEASQRQTKFVDIAKKISLRTNIHPSVLLSTYVTSVIDDEIVGSTPLMKTVKENNFEAFTHLFNIQESLEKKEYNDEDPLLGTILRADNPKFLDEFIRRTGVGIDINTVRQSAGEDLPVALNDHNRLYLGLNIHGKKRADLARKGDPNADQYQVRHIPLVWNAISQGGKTILEYLSSEKPLAAYKHFATNGEGDRAEWLRHSKNLESSLSGWLGWQVNSLGESPLAMAVMKNQKGVLPVLFSKAAKIMGPALHAKIKFLGFNALLLAAKTSCDNDIFDFLLKKGVSPLETDTQNGWNIYHWLCVNKASKSMEYLLERLPREISEELLAQRSKGKLSTPLHLAVKSGGIRLVKAVLSFTKEGLLIRDAHGFTPLHHAVRCGYPIVTQDILNVIPEEGLYLENGVGKTPYEDAQKRAMKPTTQQAGRCDPKTLQSIMNIQWDVDTQAQERRLKNVIATMNRLVGDGIMEKGSSLGNAFEKFVSATEGRLVKIKNRAKETKSENDNPSDTTNPIETFAAVAKGVSGAEAKRTLVHVRDVQRSVARSLKDNTGDDDSRVQVGDELEDEEDEESKEKAKMMTFQQFVTPNDNP